MTGTLVFAGITYMLLLLIIAALLRHLNCERVERKEMMVRYQEMALQVRQINLKEESAAAQAMAAQQLGYEFSSSVGEVEGE